MSTPELEITESVVIKIPGIRQAKRFLQISDAHIAKAYPGAGEEEQVEVLESEKRWNDAGVSALETFHKLIRLVRKENPDTVLMVGDMIDYYTENNVNCLKELLADFPTDYLYVCGNHEHGSYGMALPDVDMMYSKLAPMMRNAVSFYVQDFEGFRIVCLDNSTFDITEGQLEKMKAVMAESVPVILVMHIPLWTEEFERIAWSMLDCDEKTTDNARAFTQLVRGEESCVTAVIAGHEHLSWSGEFAPGKMQYVSAPVFERFVREIIVTSEEE